MSWRIFSVLFGIHFFVYLFLVCGGQVYAQDSGGGATPTPSPQAAPPPSLMPNPSVEPSPAPTPASTPDPALSPNPRPSPTGIARPDPTSRPDSPPPATPMPSPVPSPSLAATGSATQPPAPPPVTKPPDPPHTMNQDTPPPPQPQATEPPPVSDSPTRTLPADVTGITKWIIAPSLLYTTQQLSGAYNSNEPISTQSSQALTFVSFLFMTAGSIIFKARV